MANTLTDLVPDMIEGMEVVSRELVGFIPRVMRSASEERAAKGQTVRNPVAPKQTTGTITPAATPPALTDNVYTNRTISMDTLKDTGFHYTGEEEKGLKLSGAYSSLFAQNFAQSFRVITNEIEAAIAALYYNACRAYGTAGTTPFASDLSDLAKIKKMMDDNGAPMGDRHLVMDTTAGLNVRSLTQLSNVNQSGSSDLLRDGDLGRIFGFNLAESDAVKTHTVGTSTGQDCTAIEPVGETTITYDGGDGGTILVGDTVSFAGATDDPDGNASKYLVNTAVTAASGSIVINAPGVLTATSVAQEITLGATNYAANLAFTPDAMVLATRPPAKPEGGDAADEEIVVTDPVSGISVLVSKYKGFHANQYRVSYLYGVGLGNPEHMVLLMG